MVPLDVFECVLDYIMHNEDMQVLRDHVHLAHNTRRDHMHSRRDYVHSRRDCVCLVENDAHDMCPRRDNHFRLYSRDRSRRT